MSENKKYLGWGLVGTPSGRQYTGDGIDKELNVGKNFELGQMLGGCLPAPMANDPKPLYCLKSQLVGDHYVLGFALYFSVKEKNQNRAGTYFGGFVETVNSSFGVSSIREVLSAVYDLALYQYKHFIDKDKMEYHTNINGVVFEAPHEKLNKIAEQLQPLDSGLRSAKPADSLFIHCEEGQAILVAEKLIESGIYRRFKDIYFSESKYISEQVSRERITQTTAFLFLNIDLFTQPLKAEVAYMQQVAEQAKASQQNAENNLQKLKAEQETIIQNMVNKRAREYIQQAEYYKAEMQKIQQEAGASGKFAILGKQVFDFSAQNAEQLGNAKLAQFARPNENQEVLSKLAIVDQKLSSLSLKLNQVNTQPVMEEEASVDNSMNIILGVIASILFFVAIAGWGFYWSDDSAKQAETAKTALQQTKDQLNQLNREIDGLKSQNIDLQEKLNSSKKQLVDMSDKKDVSNKKKGER